MNVVNEKKKINKVLVSNKGAVSAELVQNYPEGEGYM